MRVTGLLGAAALAAVATATSAWAQDVYRGRNGRDGYAYPRDSRIYSDAAYRFGFDKGYEEGLHHGDKDGHKRADFNFWHEGTYRNGDKGYRSSYGSRARYIQGFRSGYETGYRDGYETYRYGQNHRRGNNAYGYNGDRYGTSRQDQYGYGAYPEGYYRDRNGVLRDRNGRPVAEEYYNRR
jgi:hypothetical protein